MHKAITSRGDSQTAARDGETASSSPSITRVPYTYLLRCRDGSYYAGSTWHLDRRVWEHNSPDLGAAYTRVRRPVTLAWAGWFASMTEAFAFEKQIQGWNRRKREALIRGDFEALPALARRSSVQARERLEEDGAPGG